MAVDQPCGGVTAVEEVRSGVNVRKIGQKSWFGMILTYSMPFRRMCHHLRCISDGPEAMGGGGGPI